MFRHLLPAMMSPTVLQVVPGWLAGRGGMLGQDTGQSKREKNLKIARETPELKISKVGRQCNDVSV